MKSRKMKFRKWDGVPVDEETRDKWLEEIITKNGDEDGVYFILSGDGMVVMEVEGRNIDVYDCLVSRYACSSDWR